MGRDRSVECVRGASGPRARAGVVRIRGTASFRNSVNALVLIDGIKGTLGSVHPRDIASNEVLKDPAGAIDGARGANGVLLITTMKKSPQATSGDNLTESQR